VKPGAAVSTARSVGSQGRGSSINTPHSRLPWELRALAAAKPALLGAIVEKVVHYKDLLKCNHGGTVNLGFALLARDGHHLMLQTAASLAEDVPAVAASGATHLMYNDVEGLDEVIAALPDVEILVGPRTTFYGAREVFCRIAPGQVVAFAEHAAQG